MRYSSIQMDENISRICQSVSPVEKFETFWLYCIHDGVIVHLTPTQLTYLKHCSPRLMLSLGHRSSSIIIITYIINVYPYEAKRKFHLLRAQGRDSRFWGSQRETSDFGMNSAAVITGRLIIEPSTGGKCKVLHHHYRQSRGNLNPNLNSRPDDFGSSSIQLAP